MARESRPYPEHRGKSVSWRFQHGGKRYRFPTEHEAWRKLAELVRDPLIEPPAPETVVGLIERYEFHTGRRASWHFDPLDQFAGEKPLSSLTSDFLITYRRWLEQQRPKAAKGAKTAPERYSAETIRKWVAAAGGLFRFARYRGWIRVEFLPHGVPQPKPKPKSLTAAELRAWLRAFPDRRDLRAMIRLGRYTGMRPGELRRLTWDSVRWDLDSIWIDAAKHKTGRATGEPRIVALNSRATRVLRQLQRAGASPRWIFPSPRSGKPYTRDGLAAIFGRRGLALNRLRHTFAQVAIDAGLSIDAVAAAMGHTDSKITRVYAKIRDRSIRAVADAAAGKRRQKERA